MAQNGFKMAQDGSKMAQRSAAQPCTRGAILGPSWGPLWLSWVSVCPELHACLFLAELHAWLCLRRPKLTHFLGPAQPSPALRKAQINSLPGPSPAQPSPAQPSPASSLLSPAQPSPAQPSEGRVPALPSPGVASGLPTPGQSLGCSVQVPIAQLVHSSANS